MSRTKIRVAMGYALMVVSIIVDIKLLDIFGKTMPNIIPQIILAATIQLGLSFHMITSEEV